ncbi:MAG: acyltransferase [Halodesulfurarchaeum sp.]
MSRWTAVKSPWTVARNYAVIVLARHSPSLRLKNWLFRRLGMSVEVGVTWAPESTPDIFFPELISIDADAIVGFDATILCHEFLTEECRTGRVRIGSDAMIGAGAIVLPGVEIGHGAQVAANSLVTEDVPPETTVAGVPAKPLD